MEAEKLDHKLEPEPAKENTVKSDATADDDLDALLDGKYLSLPYN